MPFEPADLQSPDAKPTRRIPLSDGFSVSVEFFELVRAMVDAGLSSVSPRQVRTAEELVGESAWGLLDDGERRMAGRCIAHLVCRGLLPLTFVKHRHEYPLRYRLR